MCNAPGRPLEGPYLVEPLDYERPRDGDHLEHLGQQVSLSSVVLASFVGAYDLLGVGHRGWLVETLPECISDQGSRCGVMPTDSSLDVLEEVLPLQKSVSFSIPENYPDIA